MPLSADVKARASTSLLPEIVTVPVGVAAREPAKAEPSDIDTETAATVVPAAALSGRDAAFGVKLTPVDMALTWTSQPPIFGFGIAPGARHSGAVAKGGVVRPLRSDLLSYVRAAEIGGAKPQKQRPQKR